MSCFAVFEKRTVRFQAREDRLVAWKSRNSLTDMNVKMYRDNTKGYRLKFILINNEVRIILITSIVRFKEKFSTDPLFRIPPDKRLFNVPLKPLIVKKCYQRIISSINRDRALTVTK
ncbi:hypothetical protein CJ483_02310 [Bacillus sp. PK3_68]|nr:hypothetical protein CJ483_02310 [Bacillus sp. PK3_68]